MGLERLGTGRARETLTYSGPAFIAIGGWFNMNAFSDKPFMSLQSSTGVGEVSISMLSDGKIIGESVHTLGLVVLTTTTTYSTSTWHHIIYFEGNGGDRFLVMDRVLEDSSGTNISFTGNLDIFEIFGTGSGSPFDELITGAEWFYFNWASWLDDTVKKYMIDIAKGASPDLPLYSPIQSKNLLPIAYVQGFSGPASGALPYDIMQGQTLTKTGNMFVRDIHPLISYPY